MNLVALADKKRFAVEGKSIRTLDAPDAICPAVPRQVHARRGHMGIGSAAARHADTYKRLE